MDPPPNCGSAVLALPFKVGYPMRGDVACVRSVTLNKVVGEFLDFFVDRHRRSPTRAGARATPMLRAGRVSQSLAPSIAADDEEACALSSGLARTLGKQDGGLV